MSEKSGYRYIARGRVQGVGFRAFTKKIADTMRVKGTVRNLPDGTVEAKAVFASENQRQEFESALREGPALGKVTHLQAVPLAPSEIEALSQKSDFSIEY